MKCSDRRWKSWIVLVTFAALVGGCFSEPPDPDPIPEACDNIGIKDFVVVPPTPVVGTEFEFQWTRVGAVHIIESGPGIAFIPGNSNVTARLETAGALVAELVEPFDYTDFGNGEGEFEQPEEMSVAELMPTFVDLAPGEYIASLEVIGSSAPVCAPQGTSNSATIEFTIGPGSACAAPGVTLLDLEIRDLAIAGDTTSIEWTVDYNVESDGNVSPGSDVALEHAVTVTDANTGTTLGSTTVSTAGLILPGESVTETLQLMSILNQPPQNPVTIRVEVIPGQADAECGGAGEDLTANNTIEITTQL